MNERITRWREHRDISKAELARRLELSAAAITQFENGDNDPSLDTVEAIANELAGSMEVFYGEAPPKKKREAKAS